MRTTFYLLAISIVTITCDQSFGQDVSQKATLSQIKINYVRDTRPYQYRDAEYKLKEATTAYLVQFDLTGLTKYATSAVDFYVGEYKIPEYGSTKTGIYFRIYDKTLLKSLKDQKIFYQVEREKKIPFDKVFSVPDPDKLPLEEESKVIKTM